MEAQFNPQDYLKLSQPLTGDNPVGEDASNGDDFELLNEELAKAEGVNIQPIDWAKVDMLCYKILNESSKDLKAAACITIALYEQYSFAGLAVGLRLFGDMVNADYWPDVHPKRKGKRQNKARSACFGWALFRIDKVLATFEVNEKSNFEDLLATADAFTYVDGALSERLEDDAPDCTEARNRFKRIKQEARAWLEQANKQQDAVEPAPVESKPESPAVSATAPKPSKPTVQTQTQAFTPPTETVIAASKQDIDKAMASSRKTIDSVVSALLSGNPYDPMAFYLSRTATWMMVDELPMNEVMPPNPTEAQIENLEGLLQNKHYQALIEEGEKLFSQGAIFHIGLHRLIANALEAENAQEAAHMVKICVAQLLQRLPKLMTLKFVNKQPFVDDLTKSWLETIGNVTTGTNDGNNSNDKGKNSANPWIIGFNQASEVLAKGDFEAAIAVITNGITKSTSSREKTYWQLMQARLCDHADHTELALSQLQYLEGLIKDNVLTQWEPSLRVDIITELLKCHEKQMAKTTYTAEQKQALTPLYNELSLKAPVVALSISIN